MSHLLIIELADSDDPAILEGAHRLEHTVTFATADWSYYDSCPENTSQAFAKVNAILKTTPYTYEAFEAQILAVDQKQPIDAVLCLTDVRLIDAARIAERLHLPFLSVETAMLLRDKFTVRKRLSERGIPQPQFLLAQTNQEILAGIDELGVPVLMKPADGFGSQHIISLTETAEFEQLRGALSTHLPLGGDYGYGVVPNGRQLIERYMQGKIIGCDTLTLNGTHHLLGINEKHYFPAPLFAVRGSVFPSERFDTKAVQEYLFATLNAVGFNHGAAHTELILTQDGWRLIEINGRLVGAGISKLVSVALDRSIHELLIAMHLDEKIEFPISVPYYGATRWVSSPLNGTLLHMTFPEDRTCIEEVKVCHFPGDMVYMPIHNDARLACVIARGSTMEEAEAAAEKFVAQTEVAVDGAAFDLLLG